MCLTNIFCLWQECLSWWLELKSAPSYLKTKWTLVCGSKECERRKIKSIRFSYQDETVQRTKSISHIMIMMMIHTIKHWKVCKLVLLPLKARFCVDLLIIGRPFYKFARSITMEENALLLMWCPVAALATLKCRFTYLRNVMAHQLKRLRCYRNDF